MHYSLSEKDNWETPKELFNQLNETFSFTIDACATIENAKVPRFYPDCLNENWDGERVFMNPPYGRGITSKFVEYAIDQVYNKNCPLCVLVIPNATETVHFQKCVEAGAKVIFPKGRVSFVHPETKKAVSGNTKGTAIIILAKIFKLGF